MINIQIPSSFRQEREYTLDVVFGHFLCIDYKISISNDVNSYVLALPNGNSLSIEDHFFSQANEKDGYLHEKSLFENVKTVNTELIDYPIALIYGKDDISISETRIKCGIDVFASIFFMLSRWEEIVIKDRDKHKRIDESKLSCIIHGLHQKPIVDEWVELIWKMLSRLDPNLVIKKNEFSIKITHDVDHIARYDSIKKLISALGGDVILRKNPLLIFKTLTEFTQTLFGLKKDNYDTFDDLMDFSEEIGLKSHFYFIPSKKGEYDARYDIGEPKTKRALEGIMARGHVIGIHGSYNSYNDSSTFLNELERLSAYTSVSEGRQHYLRFENPKTWQIWADAGLEKDGSIGFYSDIGFRAGTCHSYPVFNCLTREKLDLIEEPLIIMEGPLIRSYESIEQSIKVAKSVIYECKKHHGKFIFLWHPENFNHPFWGRYKSLYYDLLKYAKSL